MSQNKSVEEVVEDFRHTFKGCDQCNLGNGQGDWIEDFIRTAIQQERQTSQEKEREKEAYLWFNTWYDKTISNNRKEENEPFGKWATERLQKLGVHEPEEFTNPNKD